MGFCARRVGSLLVALVGCAASTPPPDDRSRCAALCERVAACGSREDFPSVAACTKDCAEDPRQTTGPCRAPRLAYEACAVELSCAELRAMEAASLDAPGPCAEARAGLLACEPVPPQPRIEFQF